jgi:hypothetical protein
MTTLSLPTLGRLAKARAIAGAVLDVLLVVMRTKTKPAMGHLRDHAYGIAGLGCIDAAAFVHSPFVGLLVTGVSFLLFEWKVNQG